MEQENKMELEVTLILTSDNTFDIEFYEPESGCFTRIACHDEGNQTAMEDIQITEEIRSWVSIMRESEA